MSNSSKFEYNVNIKKNEIDLFILVLEDVCTLFVALGFELRSSHLLGSCSYHLLYQPFFSDWDFSR
jgi:hypothetical protein